MIRRLLAVTLELAAQGLNHLSAQLAPVEWCWHITDDGTHFYPLRDAITHDPDETCVCGPTTRLETCDDHGDTYHYRHHPLTQHDVEDQ